MANTFSKEERVAFELLLEGFQDALVLSRNVSTYSTDQVTMERTSDTIWRPQPYIAQSFDGQDQTLNFKEYTQLSVPARIGYAKSVPFVLTAKELRDALQEQRLGQSAKQKLASDINVAVYADGETSPSSDASVAGNELHGTFTLSFRGHTTPAIDFNAADTVMKARIESLVSVGTVNVVRTGPDSQKVYQWAVTFLSMPGSFPPGTFGRNPGDDALLIADASMLTPSTGHTAVNTNVGVQVTRNNTGAVPMAGTFTLSFANSSTNSLQTRPIDVDSSASEVAAASNE